MTLQVLKFILAVVAIGTIFYFALIFLSHLISRLKRLTMTTRNAVAEYGPVIARGSAIGVAIAGIGSPLSVLVGSMWPILLLVFFVTAVGITRKVAI